MDIHLPNNSTELRSKKCINNSLRGKNLLQYLKKLKAEKLQTSIKYTEKFGRQENLTTCFSDYTT